ncbi:MAG: hypothetical protein JJT88_12450 [Gammaproteobacteria bacterium]|nr:hypothetical protein [Gammaproteobacteria bacterium]
MRAALLALALALLVACGGGGGSDSGDGSSGGSGTPDNSATQNSPPTAGASDGSGAGTGNSSSGITGSGAGNSNSEHTDDGETPAPSLALTGVVIDGPVAGAAVTIIDADGRELTTVVTDDQARFTANIPANARFPLTLKATGGQNLVTGTAQDFKLEGWMTEADHQSVVVSSLSTLLLQRAECAAVQDNAPRSEGLSRLLTETEHATATLAAHGLGIEAPIQRMPQDPQQAASLLLASEALAEALRRAATALNSAGLPTSVEELLWSVACDLSDGQLDASSPESEARTIAAFQTALTAVTIEASLGELWVESRDRDAVPLLAQALADTFGLQGAAPIDALPLSTETLEALLRSVHAALALAPSDALFDFYAELFAWPANTPRSELRGRLAHLTVRGQLDGLLQSLAASGEQAGDFIAWNNLAPANSLPPQLSLSAAPQSLASRGSESTTLSHSSENATVCQRISNDGNGAWNGIAAVEDALQVGPIGRIESFTLRCASLGGIAEQSVQVLVPPEVRTEFFRADGNVASLLEYGDTVTVRFQLFDVDTEQCAFRRTDNQALISDGAVLNFDSDFSISANCTGPGGNFVNSTRLPGPTVPISLAWTSPSKRENGAPLGGDLAGYRIYHGSRSGNYDGGFISIDDPEQRSATIDLPRGNRFVVVTAVAEGGFESRLSNEAFTFIP